MNRRAILAILKKDVRAITANKQVWLPMVILPLVIGVLLPSFLIIGANTTDLSQVGNTQQIADLLAQLPPGALRDMVEAMPTLNHQMTYFMINYTFTPFFLLIPIMAASVVASNSFVGEKERKTLESLLYTPLGIGSLFVAKVLAAFLPAMAISLGTFVLFGILVNGLAYPLFERLIFPTALWWALIGWVTPIVSLTAILASVLISARVKGYQEASQLSGLLVLPVVGLVISQMAGLLILDSSLLLLGGALLLAVDFLVYRWAKGWFNRNRLFESQI